MIPDNIELIRHLEARLSSATARERNLIVELLEIEYHAVMANRKAYQSDLIAMYQVASISYEEWQIYSGVFMRWEQKLYPKYHGTQAGMIISRAFYLYLYDTID